MRASDFISQSSELSLGDNRPHSSTHVEHAGSPLDRSGSPPWWLMSPGCAHGREEDAENEFLEDANQLSMELEIQDACNIDIKTTNLLGKFGEPLRSTVLANLEHTSNYLRYRNQVGKKMENRNKRGNSSVLISAGQGQIGSSNGPSKSSASTSNLAVLPEDQLPDEVDPSIPGPTPGRERISGRHANRDAFAITGIGASRGKDPRTPGWKNRACDLDSSESNDGDSEHNSPHSKHEREEMNRFIRDSIVGADDDDDENRPQVKKSVVKKIDPRKEVAKK